MHRRGAIDLGLDEAGRRVLAGKHGGQGAAQAGAGQRAFPDHHDDLAPAAPVLRQTPVLAIGLSVRGPDVAADVTAVDLDVSPGAAEPKAFNLGRHRFADLVGEHEGCLILDIKIARQSERRLALDLVAEDHDRRQVVADLQLVEGEQGARGRAEVAPAGRAAEPWRPIGPWAGPARRTTAVRADRRPLGLRPADRTEHRPGLILLHPQDLLQADGPCGGSQEKMLRYGRSPRLVDPPSLQRSRRCGSIMFTICSYSSATYPNAARLLEAIPSSALIRWRQLHKTAVEHELARQVAEQVHVHLDAEIALEASDHLLAEVGWQFGRGAPAWEQV